MYCILSLSAKLYLGLFLLINVRIRQHPYARMYRSQTCFLTVRLQVIMTDGTVEGALAPAEPLR